MSLTLKSYTLNYAHKWLKLKLVTKDLQIADGNPCQTFKLVNESMSALNTSTLGGQWCSGFITGPGYS